MQKFKTSDNFEIGFEFVPSILDKNILFIHGNLASSEWWKPSMELLKGDSEKKVLTADWRGYGWSKGLTSREQIDFERFAADYVELLESEGMTDVNVIGHSTGGLIAMLAVLQKPELFSSLTLLDSVGPTGLDLQLPKEQVLAHFEKMSVDKDYCTMILAGTIEGVDATSASFLKLAEQTFSADKVNFPGVPDRLASDIDITDRMAELKLPTLILHGDKDVVLPIAGSEKMHQQIAGSKFVILEGQGHSCNMENPEKFVDELKAFWSCQ